MPGLSGLDLQAELAARNIHTPTGLTVIHPPPILPPSQKESVAGDQRLGPNAVSVCDPARCRRHTPLVLFRAERENGRFAAVVTV